MWKYARIFLCGHYLFTVSFLGQIPVMSMDKYPSIFLHQMEAIVFIILQIFFATHAVLKIGEYSQILPSFIWRIFGHVTCWNQLHTSENIWWIINKHHQTITLVSLNISLGGLNITQVSLNNALVSLFQGSKKVSSGHLEQVGFSFQASNFSLSLARWERDQASSLPTIELKSKLRVA